MSEFVNPEIRSVVICGLIGQAVLGADPALVNHAREGGHGRSGFDPGAAYCPGHVASLANPKVCAICGTHIDEYRPEPEFEP